MDFQHHLLLICTNSAILNSLAGLRVGVFWDYFSDAEPELVAAGVKAIESLKRLGATIKNISIPHIQNLRVAHAVGISTEMSSILEYYYSTQNPPLELPTTLQISIGLSMLGTDYIAANRIRGWAMEFFAKRIFSEVDIFVTPTTPFTAPEIPLDSLDEGLSDSNGVLKLMQYIFLSNLIGFPSMSVPIDYDKDGIPIGLCINAIHWNDAVLLRVAHALEVHHINRRAPQI